MRSTRAFMLLVCVGLCLCAVAPAFPQSETANQSKGTIRGRISDEIGGLEGATVVIRGEGTTKEAITDENGAYEVEVDPGIYSVTVEPSDPDDPAFKKFERAAIRVLPGLPKTVDFSPYEGFYYCTMVGDRISIVRATNTVEAVPAHSSRPRKENLRVKFPDGKRVDAILEYCASEREQVGVIKYKSLIVSFGEVTIYSNSARRRTEDDLLIFQGKSILVKKGEHITVSRLMASFGNGIGYIDLSKGFNSSIEGRGTVGGGQRPFSLNMIRNRRFDFNYEDKDRGIKLVSEPNDFSTVTIDPAGRVTINGTGVITGSWPRLAGREFFDFTLTLQPKVAGSNSQYAISIEVPALNYRQHGDAPQNSIRVVPEKEIASIYPEKGGTVRRTIKKVGPMKTTTIAGP